MKTALSRTAALDRVMPPLESYPVSTGHSAEAASDADGQHGVGHATRVMVWANVIAHRLLDQGLDVDVDAVRWAAMLHDCCRRHDGDDPEHGERVAQLIRTGGFRCLSGLPAGTQERTAEACARHTRPGPPALWTAELLCLVEADRLDLVRYGMLDRSWLATSQARQLVSPARNLWRATAGISRASARASVRAAALRQGWWLDDAGAGRLPPRLECATC